MYCLTNGPHMKLLTDRRKLNPFLTRQLTELDRLVTSKNCLLPSRISRYQSFEHSFVGAQVWESTFHSLLKINTHHIFNVFLSSNIKVVSETSTTLDHVPACMASYTRE